MDYENIVSHLGGFGKFQRRIYLLSCFPTILAGIYTMVGVFLAAKTDFRCLLRHENPENATYQLSRNVTILAHPWDNETQNWSRCKRYDVDLTDRYDHSSKNFSLTTNVVKCDSFVYDKSTYELTTVTEFNLVCDNAWLITTADTIYLLGLMLGAMSFGELADRYGRKPILCITLVVNSVSGFLVAFSPGIVSYMILRWIVGLSASGTCLITYVTVVELVSAKGRMVAGIGMELSFTIGYILTTGFAYFIPHWRTLQIAISVPTLACLVSWWFIPESVRWLLSKGKLEEAKDLILKASLENRVELTRDTLDGILTKYNHEHEPDVKKSSIFDLLRYPNLRRKSMLLFFTRFVINCTYFGLTWNTSNLDGNDYVNFIISGLVEIPANAFVYFTLNKWGRKIILCNCLLVAGTSIILSALVPSDMPWLRILWTMMGKGAITASLTTANIFSAEQFPTVIRSVGVGACATCAYIGGILAPTINQLSITWKQLPLVIFGTGSLIAGLSALLLPETLNKKLPDSLEDGEQFGKRK